MVRKYTAKQRIKWISNFNPNFNSQRWHNDIVYHPDELLHEEYFYGTGTVKKKINPAKICGIRYGYGYNCPMYMPEGWTYDWIDLLVDLKRLDWVIDKFPTKEQVIDHIHHNEEDKTVLQYGDHYFTIGGQHRLCLAKYLELEEVEVNVIEYRLDRKQFQREKRFERCVKEFIDEGFLGSWYKSNTRIDSVGIDIGKDTVYIKKRYAEYLLSRMKELRRSPYRGLPNSLKAMNLARYDRNHIDSEQQLFLLDPYLLKHNKSILSKILGYNYPLLLIIIAY